MINDKKIEINLDELIVEIENKLSMKLTKKPKFKLQEFDKSHFAGTSNDVILLNSLYFSSENGNFYLKEGNKELLKMRLTHELIHMFSNQYGKSGICSNNKYRYNNIIKPEYVFDYNNALNEGITQMFTDEILGKVTNYFCDGYYDFKKIAQLLQYLFGFNVIADSYFNNSGLLEKGMNNYCNKLFEIINKKLALANYIDTIMIHSDIDKNINADLKIERDICKSLRKEIFYECLELIISNLIVPWLKQKDVSEMKEEIKCLLEIFNDNFTIKNKIMFFIMKCYKSNNVKLPIESSKTDNIISHLIAVNNDGTYEILDNGDIIDKNSNRVLPYDEQLYEYFYSKIIDKDNWKIINNAFNNSHISNNKINININGKTIKQRRMMMITIKQFMKKNHFLILNNLNNLDNGSQFELNYINEKLTMNDIMYLIQNYSVVCLPSDYSNVIQVIDKKNNKDVTSNSLISKCLVAYKISLLGLGSTVYRDKWEQFSSIAEHQISETGMIKKSPEYGNNPFLRMFEDGYGCEYFYDYMKKIPIDFDRIKQDLYLSENEMNTMVSQSEEENEKLVSMFSNFVENSRTSYSK